MRYTLFFLLVFSFSSCKTETENADDHPLTQDQQQKLDMTAVSMMDALATNRPRVIMDNFDHKSFSKRLGKTFFQFNKTDQSLIMGQLINTLYQGVAVLSQQITEAQASIYLIDIRKKGAVNYVVLGVTDAAESKILNYVVLYLKENKQKEFVLVNFYNVYGGKSFGQIAKEFVAIDFESERMMRKTESAQRSFNNARNLKENGKNQLAYEVMSEMNTEFKNSTQMAVYRAQLAARISDSLYIRELNTLKKITPNDQRKQMYDCEIAAMEDKNSDQSDCMDKVIELLLSE